MTDALGLRLRAARERAGHSLRELARRVGVSASLVSQIENGLVLPSVSTLYALVSELGVSMDEVVFGADRAPGPAMPSARGVDAGEVLVQRRSAREAIQLESGVRWEALTPGPVAGTEFLFVVYEPGAESSPEGTFQRHAGREWSIILSGTLHASVGFDDFVLGPGDAISYPSTVPHRLVNQGTEPVEALWFQIGELPPSPSG